MRKLVQSLAIISIFLCCNSLNAQNNNPLWLRNSAISPDGNNIAFTYMGDIYVVNSNGGEAKQLTTSTAFDSYPIWSPDGKQIAFASNREGSLDLYIMSAQGGGATRLTNMSGSEIPERFLDNNTIIFKSNIMPSAESRQFPSGTFSQLYSIKTTPGASIKMFSSMPMENLCFSSDMKNLLYTDKKGYEDEFRKHHTSSIARDIWIAKQKNNGTITDKSNAKDFNFYKLSDFAGEDRNAVFTPDNKNIFYLSEEDGTFNIWSADINQNGNNNYKLTNKQQVTKHKKNPVRFLTADKNGNLCYGYDGEIYTLKNGVSKKVNINITRDNIEQEIKRTPVSSPRVRICAVSKDGKQIAFIYKGDLYVTSTDYATTKQITNTPEQERDADFSPDGRSIVYASERDGLWQIYKTSIVNKDEKLFPYATELKEERVTKSNNVSFQPLYSPDGKEIAFLQDRTSIMSINDASGKVKKIMDGKYEYSYSDGDQWYQWSPDSKWILSNFIGNGGWNSKDVVLLDASGNGKMFNLTNSGYTDGNAKWVLDGKAIIWYSDRAGYRSHGSWGAEDDIYIMFLDLEAYEKFRMNKEESALYDEAEKLKKEEEEKAKEKDKNKDDKKSKNKKDSDKKDDKKMDETVKPLQLDTLNAEFRIIRLTSNSGNMSDAILSKKGDKLYYLNRVEGSTDLWVKDFKEGSTKVLVKNAGGGSMFTDKDEKTIYLGGSQGLRKIDMSSGSVKPIPCEFIYTYRPVAEREYIFNHAWRQVKEKFYDPKIHGVDWDGYKTIYAKFLPHINNNIDFANMLSEMLGELNASHTGARGYLSGSVLSTASLGIFTDPEYKGDGIKIKEIIRQSPLDIIKTDIKVGDIILSIDGEKIEEGKDWSYLLDGKAGKRVLLGVKSAKGGKTFNEYIKPISSGELSNLLYERWVRNNEAEVEKLSGGKIGYIHIQGMNSPSFRKMYKDLLGKNRNKEAVVVDTRHNGGGWLHDDVISLLNGKEYQKFMPRGVFIGKDPYNKWTKPSCMLICEDNYSNAHGTPWLYKELKVGKLIGAPIPGTMTAVWWESQVNPYIVFGIPQVGCVDNEGDYLENKTLNPDILVINPMEEVLNGKDRQLEEAVKSLMNSK